MRVRVHACVHACVCVCVNKFFLTAAPKSSFLLLVGSQVSKDTNPSNVCYCTFMSAMESILAWLFDFSW